MNPITHAQLDWDDQGRPHSRVFDDVYFSDQSGLEETRYVFLEQNRLQERFTALSAGGISSRVLLPNPLVLSPS